MKRLLCPLLAFLLLLTSCASRPESAQQQFFAMDTVMSITAYGAQAKKAAAAAMENVNRLDGLLSRTRENSEIFALNAAAPNPVPISEDTARVLSLASEWSKTTGGAFDVTIAPVVAAWGFGGAESFRIPSREELTRLLKLVNWTALTVTDQTAALAQEGMEVDLGGVAKGYAAGQAEQILRDAGIESALLDLGHNITVIGRKPDGALWRVAVQDPNNPDGIVGVLSLQDCSAVTSGNYQRYFEQGNAVYHHIIDPLTGYPSDSGLRSVTAVCADAPLADLLSTTLFIMGEENALFFWRNVGGFDLILVTDDNRLVVTEGLTNAFEPDENTEYTLEYAKNE